jgi:hypothetical protein
MQALFCTALTLLPAIYGGFVDPPRSFVARSAVRVVVSVGLVWMLILGILSVRPNYHTSPVVYRHTTFPKARL